MLNKFDNRYDGKCYYNFFVVFFGLFFAAYIVTPDGWRKTVPVILAVCISTAVAKFTASNRNQN